MGAPSSSELVRVEHLARRYGGAGGVHDVSFTLPAGAVTAFIGVNGAGKSTTLRCLAGLLRPDSGRITLFGGPADAAARRRIGFLPEERGLAPRERARDVIAFHARLKGLDRRTAYRRADSLLERIGLGERARARIETLSKGNAQRVQILCALAHQPDLLILDEPLSGLDPVGQSEVLSMVAEFRSAGGGVLFSTHAMGAAQQVCDRAVIISQGRTVFDGLASEACRHARHGAVVVTSDADALHAAAAAVGGEASALPSSLGEAGRWRVALPPGVSNPVLVRALAEHSVPLMAFEPIQADLEGAFWALAGPDAQASRGRNAA